jgi:CelD/BcsL family acetyltransferase involved in cellulose biosynthesis
MHIRIHTQADSFERLTPEWRALQQQLQFDSLFYTPEWQQLTWREFGRGELLLATVHADDGALIALAPLALHEGVLGFAAYKEISDYLDVLVAPGCEAAAHGALRDWLAGPDAPAWHTLSLTNVVESSSTFSIFADLLRAQGWQVDAPIEDVCPVIALPSTFDAYLAMLDGKERRELQRKLRRAAEESRVVVAADPSSLERDMNDFLALMKASMVSKSDFMTPGMEAFFHKMAAVMQQAGWLQLAFLEVGDEEPRTRAAAYLNFVYGNDVLVYNSGLDPLKYSHISPGQVLIARLIERAIAEKRRLFDFLQGNESYKYGLGGKDVVLRTLNVVRGGA